MRSLFFLLIALLLTTPATRWPQKDSCTHRILVVSVLDPQGRVTSGLSTDNFEAKVKDRPVKILSIIPDERPHRIVILLDASGSMGTTWREAVALASQLADTRLPNTKMGLLIFGETINEKIDFTGGQSAIAERLRQLGSDPEYAAQSVRGRTALFDALLAGARLLENPTSADILYLVSDGGDTASHLSFDELARQLTLFGIRVFVSGVFDVQSHRNKTPEENRGATDIGDLVKRTGGELIVPFPNGIPANPKEMDKLASMLSGYHRQMIEDYLLEVEFSDRPDKRRRLELRFSKEKREQWKNVTITYPAELSSCVP